MTLVLPELTPAEIKFFQDNGYLGPIKLYEPEEAGAILREIRKKSYDQSKSVFNNAVNYDRHLDVSELTTHMGHPGIVGRLRSLIGSDILGWRTEFHVKFPGSAGTEWHQVETYRFSSGKSQIMPTKKVQNEPYDLTVWTTFTDATKENGCMRFIPRSHKKLFFDENKPTKNAVKGQYKSIDSGTGFYGYTFADYKVDPNWNPDDEEVVSLEMKPGECVFFTALCVHSSHPNTTKRSTRFAVSTRYVPTHTRVYPDTVEYDAHGSHFNLEKYAAVMLSGKDIYGHNKITRENFMGEPFPYYSVEEEDTSMLNEVLCIWKKIINISDNETISYDDNFFDIGGHSLHIADILPRLEKTFNLKLEAKDLFNYTTVRKLVRFISWKAGQ